VVLGAQEITDALTAIEFWEKEGLLRKDKASTVFTIQQARLLGNYLALGLAKAKPDQDIVFALSALKKGFLGISDRAYMAGRAFYKDDRLHIILGDYDRPADKGMENAVAATGPNELQYYFTEGSRSSRSSGFKKNILTGNGIDAYQQGDKRRQDWFVIDVHAAAQAYAARSKKTDTPSAANTAAIQQEAAKMANERREMRAEMARMRKEMSESSNSNGGKTAEDRLAELDELHKKKLITDAEYEEKRKQILNDL
jgi:pyruvate/2-oxoglutarate dehydrogenase complex dihydrolipoamide acyltransferase (E2) component